MTAEYYRERTGIAMTERERKDTFQADKSALAGAVSGILSVGWYWGVEHVAAKTARLFGTSLYNVRTRPIVMVVMAPVGVAACLATELVLCNFTDYYSQRKLVQAMKNNGELFKPIIRELDKLPSSIQRSIDPKGTFDSFDVSVKAREELCDAKSWMKETVLSSPIALINYALVPWHLRATVGLCQHFIAQYQDYQKELYLIDRVLVETMWHSQFEKRA